MARVTFIDTSVLLNLLDVPNRNADRARVAVEYQARKGSSQMILPLSAVVETGNHVAQISNGDARRKCASMLQDVVAGRAPFVLHQMGWDSIFLQHLLDGGSTATSLIEHLTGQVIGCGDMSVLVERDLYRARVAKGTVADIWTLDHGLQAYP